jgi:Zn-dependent protease/CBS domain-containing protein
MIMFFGRWRLFRLAGIPIYVDASWLIILALVSWNLVDIFRDRVPNLGTSTYWVMGIGTALAYFICIVLHELGHAFVARASGLPIQGITLFLFGGVAEMKGEPPSAGSEFFMAIPGPLVTAVLTAVFGLLCLVGMSAGWRPATLAILQWLAFISGFVLIFNMVPAFPLDGGRVFRSILWGILGSVRQATYWATLLGRTFAWVLIAGGFALLFIGPSISGIWLMLIGWFLMGAARRSYQQVLIREVLKGEPVRRFMNPEPIVVPPSLDLRRWVEEYVYRYHRKVFPVASDGRLEGFIGTRALTRIPREEWENHTVGEVMQHDLRGITIRPDADALQALAKMQRTGLSRLLVTEADRLVGIVSLKDLLRFFQLKLELESEDEKPEAGPSPEEPPDNR